MHRLLIASHNKSKSKDLARLFIGHPIGIQFAYEMNMPDIEETGKSFEENARLKSTQAAKTSGMLSLADDSGLCIPSWDNQPGIHSKRFAQSKGGWKAGMNALKPFALKNEEAIFYCSLSMAWPDGENVTVLGALAGFLSWPPKGEYGSGFDPIFSLVPNGERIGEMSEQRREHINHRANAFLKLQDYICIGKNGVMKAQKTSQKQ